MNAREALVEPPVDAKTWLGPEVVFSRVLVGVDGSPESREAARQAARLLGPSGVLSVVSAYDIAPALAAGVGTGVPVYLDEGVQRQAAEDALRRACRRLSGDLAPVAKVVRGRASEELLREAEREHATLIAVGSHGIGRARGILVGATATELVHRARCPVLVARTADHGFPRRIVLGVDGSRQSLLAAEVAVELVERFGARLRVVAATGGMPVDVGGLVEIRGFESAVLAALRSGGLAGPIHVPLLEWSEGPPVEALLAAAAEADLLIVGSRGLHGISALGSVSERIAHRARSSVLIVREPAAANDRVRR